MTDEPLEVALDLEDTQKHKEGPSLSPEVSEPLGGSVFPVSQPGGHGGVAEPVPNPGCHALFNPIKVSPAAQCSGRVVEEAQSGLCGISDTPLGLPGWALCSWKLPQDPAAWPQVTGTGHIITVHSAQGLPTPLRLMPLSVGEERPSSNGERSLAGSQGPEQLS